MVASTHENGQAQQQTVAVVATPRLVDQYLSELNRRRNQVVAMVPAIVAAEQAAQVFVDIVQRVHLWDTATRHVEIHVECVAQTWRQVADLLRFFGRRGYHQTEKPFDHACSPCRRYTLFGFIIVTVEIAGDACRFVQVGVEERPIYGLQCGDT